AGDAAGTVTYTLYQGEGCDGTPVHGPETVTVSGGEVPPSATVENLGQGTYHWVVEYSGDANNNGDTSECGEETFTIGKWQPTVTTGMLADGEPLEQGETVERGTSVSDSATLSNVYDGVTPTGTVTYTLYRGSCPGGDVVGASDPLP